ncbi:hypothetical protein CKG00_12685 [Morganella morganii]|uniref:Uncharacterized protein n=1 Tax=Morganella morganii TaxID=582 RepID=A0A433ZYD7_MORMO|nr:hypothetical protein CKG00_12685 [Morganella morganii]
MNIKPCYSETDFFCHRNYVSKQVTDFLSGIVKRKKKNNMMMLFLLFVRSDISATKKFIAEMY